MSEPVHARLTRKKHIREYNGRGSIYAWLRAHYGEVARQREVEQRPWLVLILEMVEDGVRREDGKEPSVKNVSRVWERVCRDVAANAAATAASGPAIRKFPSRISPDWRPQTLPPPPPPPVPPPPMPVASGSTALSGRSAPPRHEGMTPEGQATIDRAWASLVAEDERKFRFG